MNAVGDSIKQACRLLSQGTLTSLEQRIQAKGAPYNLEFDFRMLLLEILDGCLKTVLFHPAPWA